MSCWLWSVAGRIVCSWPLVLVLFSLRSWSCGQPWRAGWWVWVRLYALQVALILVSAVASGVLVLATGDFKKTLYGLQVRKMQGQGGDLCWDPLRQHRARRGFGQDPDEANVRRTPR